MDVKQLEVSGVLYSIKDETARNNASANTNNINKLFDEQTFINVSNSIPPGIHEISDIPNIKKLYFPAGTWTFNGERTFSNCQFWGDGVETVIKINGSITFSNCVIMGIKFGGTSGITLDNVAKLENCVIDCTDYLNVNTISCGMTQNCDATFINTLFEGANKGQFAIWCNNTVGTKNKLKVAGCTFNNYVLNAIFTSAPIVEIAHSTFNGNHQQSSPTGGGQIDFKDTTTDSVWKVSNCRFFNPAAATSGIEVEVSNNTLPCLMIDNCFIRSVNGAYPIALQGGCYVVSCNNKLFEGSAGILLNGYARVVSIGDYNAVSPKYSDETKVTEIAFK